MSAAVDPEEIKEEVPEVEIQHDDGGAGECHPAAPRVQGGARAGLSYARRGGRPAGRRG